MSSTSSGDTRSGEEWAEAVNGCPICGHAGWCRVSPDGEAVACRRVELKSIRTLTYVDETVAYLHLASGTKRSASPSVSGTPRPNVQRAADADLDRVYQRLLSSLTLNLSHREQLLARGLTDQDILRAGYKSLPLRGRAALARGLLESFPEELLAGVPGVVTRRGDNGNYLSLAGRPGMLVPVRDIQGQVVGLLTRPDEQVPGGPKYAWLSSRSAGGASSGTRVHVPMGAAEATPLEPGRWLIVEGALKADVVFALSRRPVIGLPACQLTSEAFTVLQTLNCCQPLLALDADVAVNQAVSMAQQDGLSRLRRLWGCAAGLLNWPLGVGKGLDDVLLNWRLGGNEQ